MNNVFKPIKYLRGPLIVVSRVYHLYIHEIYIKRGGYGYSDRTF